VAVVRFQTFADIILIKALLSDTCNARRAPCILVNLAAVGWTLQWTL